MALTFHYHFNCRHINDNACDIKLSVMVTTRNTFYASLQVISYHNDANRRDLKCIWLQSIDSSYIFIITSIVGILMRMQVILNLV